MATDVYANSNEIASKSASGSSRMAFPDVCHTPPATASPTPIKPFPPGVPIPYPNTCFAPDITNGSRTVFILGKEIALEDLSYFSTSTGDEAATMALAKGIRSGAIKGRAHFRNWSPNVKVEGRGVARHLDWVSHNHANPPNALQRQYISQRMRGADCDSDRRAIERACPEKRRPREQPKNNFKPRRKSLGRILRDPVSALDEIGKKGYTRTHGGMDSWLEDYCTGLWIKPLSGKKNAPNEFDELKKQLEGALDILKMDTTQIALTVFGEIADMAYERLGRWFLFRKLGGLTARSVLKNVVGGVAGATGIGLVVTAGMAAWTLADIISTAQDLAEALGPEGMEHLDDLLNLDRLKEEATRKIKDFSDKGAEGFIAELMTAKASTSRCLTARKCMLVPYNKTGAAQAKQSGEGCCPGQSGHHVMPGAMFGHGKGQVTRPCYVGKHSGAPTICLEGATNNHGSHGKAHEELEKAFLRAEIPEGSAISYEKASELSIEAIREVAPHCSAACLQAQLDAYYQSCRNSSDLIANSGNRATPEAPAIPETDNNTGE